MESLSCELPRLGLASQNGGGRSPADDESRLGLSGPFGLPFAFFLLFFRPIVLMFCGYCAVVLSLFALQSMTVNNIIGCSAFTDVGKIRAAIMCQSIKASIAMN